MMRIEAPAESAFVNILNRSKYFFLPCRKFPGWNPDDIKALRLQGFVHLEHGPGPMPPVLKWLAAEKSDP